MTSHAAAGLLALVAAFLVAGCSAPPQPKSRPSSSVQTERQAEAACPTSPLGRAFSERVPTKGQHDVKRLERAVLYYTNFARCQRGLAPLRRGGGVAMAAQNHANDMARLSFFDHVSPVRARRTLSDRLGEVRAPYRRAAENIIESRYMAYENSTRFQVIDAARCLFVTADGRPLERHTYQTLAKEVVDRWLASEGHRRNLLDPDVGRHGFAIAPNRSTSLCGGIYAAQVFAG